MTANIRMIDLLTAEVLNFLTIEKKTVIEF